MSNEAKVSMHLEKKGYCNSSDGKGIKYHE